MWNLKQAQCVTFEYSSQFRKKKLPGPSQRFIKRSRFSVSKEAKKEALTLSRRNVRYLVKYKTNSLEIWMKRPQCFSAWTLWCSSEASDKLTARDKEVQLGMFKVRLQSSADALGGSENGKEMYTLWNFMGSCCKVQAVLAFLSPILDLG